MHAGWPNELRSYTWWLPQNHLKLALQYPVKHLENDYQTHNKNFNAFNLNSKHCMVNLVVFLPTRRSVYLLYTAHHGL